MRLLNPTGGLTYHWRARRYRATLWAPFRLLLAQALDAWNPPERQLIVLGPSGGYTLPDDFLRRFDKLYMFDPDRLAPFFFRRQHPGAQAQWSRQDLIFRHGQFDADLLIEELKSRPEAAILFANLLGQLPLLNDDLAAMRSWWQGLQATLNERSWFSYHDLFSFADGGSPVEVVDHGTSELFANHLATWKWKFSPRRTQVIGAAFHRSASI